MSRETSLLLQQAVAAEKRGEADVAARHYRAILAAMPNHAKARKALDRLEGTPPPLARKPAGNPGQQEIATMLALAAAGRHADAVTEGQRLLAIYPSSVLVHAMLGASYIGVKRGEDAARHYRTALAGAEGVAELHCGLGDALILTDDIVGAMASFERALTLQPNHAKAAGNLGSTLLRLGHVAKALELYDLALSLSPDDARFATGRGNALSRLHRHPEAIASFERALAIDARSGQALAAKLHQQMKVCDWSAVAEFEAARDWLGMTGDQTPSFPLLSLADDPERQRKVAEDYARASFPIVSRPAFAPPPARPDRLRVGYFSGDLREHAVMEMLAGLFRAHDPQRFEVHVYSFSGNAPHPARTRLATQVAALHEVTAASEAQIVDLARAHRLDVAVDLMGPTQGARTGIFNHRVAPVQMMFLGFPGTFANDFTDYLIADEVVIPGEERQHYAERIVYLPDSFMPADNWRPIALDAGTRADHGLPEDALVLCSFNNSYKITPAEFDIWCRIMQQVDGSVLWLRGDSAKAESALRGEAAARGISGDRVLFAQRVAGMAEHLARHRHADLFLDTFHYNAHSTAVDALWAGLPVLTMAGRSFAARVAASLNHAVGMAELVTHSLREYEALALELAGDRSRLRALRDRLAGNIPQSALFDTERHARRIEAGYDAAYARWLAGDEPADIVVSR